MVGIGDLMWLVSQEQVSLTLGRPPAVRISLGCYVAPTGGLSHQVSRILSAVWLLELPGLSPTHAGRAVSLFLTASRT
jgi:hypothetical protein